MRNLSIARQLDRYGDGSTGFYKCPCCQWRGVPWGKDFKKAFNRMARRRLKVIDNNNNNN